MTSTELTQGHFEMLLFIRGPAGLISDRKMFNELHKLGLIAHDQYEVWLTDEGAATLAGSKESGGFEKSATRDEGVSG